MIAQWDADHTLSLFLEDFIQQPYFQQTQLIIVGNEISKNDLLLISDYAKKYPQIQCLSCQQEIPLATIINNALAHCDAEFITLMSMGDFRDAQMMQMQIQELQDNKTIDAVYSDYFVNLLREGYRVAEGRWYIIQLPEFHPVYFYRDMPGPMCIWRASLHKKYGYLDEKYSFSYWWEFWNRCVFLGAQLKKVKGYAGDFFLDYNNKRKIFNTPYDHDKSYFEDKCIRNNYEILWSAPLATASEKRFVIVTASYKNKDWYKRNLDSLLNQNYTNYHILYIDDNSPDQTGAYVKEYVKLHKKEHLITVICNETRVGALANIYNAVHQCAPDDIVILVDGDDWLANNNILAYLNIVYQNPDTWMTYGQFQWFPSGVTGFSTRIPDEIIEKNAIRNFTWVTTHLRTFYAGLFHAIDAADLIGNDGQFYPMGWDFAIMLPLIEMAGKHSYFVHDIMYIYNTANAINDDKVNVTLQTNLANEIRSKKPYLPRAHY